MATNYNTTIPYKAITDDSIAYLKQLFIEYYTFINWTIDRMPTFKEVVEFTKDSIGLERSLHAFKYLHEGWKLNFSNDTVDYLEIYSSLQYEYNKYINLSEYELEIFKVCELNDKILSDADEKRKQFTDLLEKFISVQERYIIAFKTTAILDGLLEKNNNHK